MYITEMSVSCDLVQQHSSEATKGTLLLSDNNSGVFTLGGRPGGAGKATTHDPGYKET